MFAKYREEPDYSRTRPPQGWSALPEKGIAERALRSEQRTGRSADRVDLWIAVPHDMFSLCNVWFYYGENDKLVDAEWQWHSD